MKKIIPLLLMFTLIGCTNTTILEMKKEESSNGYSLTKLTENNIDVFYTSRKNQSLEKTKDLLLLSSSLIVLDKNYKYFKVVSEDIKPIYREDKKPNYLHMYEYDRYLWQNDIEIVSIDRYRIYEGVQNIIMSNTKEVDYLDADSIKKSIISKYKENIVIK